MKMAKLLKAGRSRHSSRTLVDWTAQEREPESKESRALYGPGSEEGKKERSREREETQQVNRSNLNFKFGFPKMRHRNVVSVSLGYVALGGIPVLM